MIKDMPKLESPFERQEVNGKYVCVPKIRDEYRWIFTDESIAVEKLDGTNVSIYLENGKIKEIFNRTNAINLFEKNTFRFIDGIYMAIEREYLLPYSAFTGQVFGELIGPSVNGNPYKLDPRHLWIPFDYMKEHYYFKFWVDFVKGLNGLDDEQIFNKTSDVFKGLWSIYKRSKKITGEVNEDTKFEGMASEGIVFYRKGFESDYTKCCKLRRDMFDWFKGRANKEQG